MYSVMLVDDERLDLLGIERLVPWAEYEMKVVATVTSGFEAVQILHQQPVDLLVTDIRMPNMTGLELAEQAREQYPRLKMLFISGYQDFQYAKKALSMQASGYVLKPINYEELFQQVRLIKEQLDQEREQERREVLWHQSLPLAKEHFLHQWLEGDINEVVARACIGPHAVFDAPGVSQRLTVVIIEIDDIVWKLNMYEEGERKAIIHKTLQELYRFLAERTCSLYCKIAECQIAVLLLHTGDLLEPLFDELIGAVQQATNLSIAISVGIPVEHLDEVSRSYQQAKHAVISKNFSGKRQNSNHRLIKDIELYVENHIGESLTLRDVAHHFGFSPNYLGQLFKDNTRETFTEYVNRKRLEKAVLLLKNPKLKVYEIAAQLGYNDLTYFGRQFKELFGQTPGEFRKQL